jgi:hypothetical protein
MWLSQILAPPTLAILDLQSAVDKTVMLAFWRTFGRVFELDVLPQPEMIQVDPA